MVVLFLYSFYLSFRFWLLSEDAWCASSYRLLYIFGLYGLLLCCLTTDSHVTCCEPFKEGVWRPSRCYPDEGFKHVGMFYDPVAPPNKGVSWNAEYLGIMIQRPLPAENGTFAKETGLFQSVTFSFISHTFKIKICQRYIRQKAHLMLIKQYFTSTFYFSLHSSIYSALKRTREHSSHGSWNLWSRAASTTFSVASDGLVTNLSSFF